MSWKNKTLILVATIISSLLLSTDTFAETFDVKFTDEKLYNAIKTCVTDGKDRDVFEQALLELDMENAFDEPYCGGFDNYEFVDESMTLKFDTIDDWYDVTTISLPGQGLTNVDDLLKFDTSIEYFLQFNDIETINLPSDYGNWNEEMIETHEAKWKAYIMPEMRAYRNGNEFQLYGNKLKEIPVFYRLSDELMAGTSQYISPENVANWTYSEISRPSTKFGAQYLSDEYSGESYELPPIVKQISDYYTLNQITVGFYNEENVPNIGVSKEAAEEIAEYYHIDNWLTLKNAKLSEDYSTLTPIDKMEDMEISFCRPLSEVPTSPIIKMLYMNGNSNPTDDEIKAMTEPMMKYFNYIYKEGNGQGCVMDMKIKTLNTPEQENEADESDKLNPNTIDGAQQSELVVLASAAMLFGLIAFAKFRK